MIFLVHNSVKHKNWSVLQARFKTSANKIPNTSANKLLGDNNIR